MSARRFDLDVYKQSVAVLSVLPSEISSFRRSVRLQMTLGAWDHLALLVQSDKELSNTYGVRLGLGAPPVGFGLDPTGC